MSQVFVSYSRRDLSFVERMIRDLKQAGIVAWYDLSGLEGGERWGEKIQKAIRESDCVIVVLSPDSVNSEWVEREFLFASNLKKKIIPLMYRQCELPFDYLNLNYIDVQGENYQLNYEKILRSINPGAPAFLPQIQKQSETFKPSSSRTLPILIGVLIIGGGLVCAALVFLYPSILSILNRISSPTLPVAIDISITPDAASLAQPEPTMTPTIPQPTHTSIPMATLAPTLKPVANFSGGWWTNFAEIDFKQQGDVVTGDYLQYGTSNRIQTEGKVDDNVLKGFANGYYYELTMNASKTGFDGWWGDHYHWCGAQAGKPLPDGCGFSGKWDVGGTTWASGSTMILVQTGSKVSGSYTPITLGVYDGKAEASLSNYGFDADGTWYVGNGSGTFHWNFPDRTYNQFIGYFQYQGDDKKYPWCGWRNGAGNPCP